MWHLYSTRFYFWYDKLITVITSKYNMKYTKYLGRPATAFNCTKAYFSHTLIQHQDKICKPPTLLIQLKQYKALGIFSYSLH